MKKIIFSLLFTALAAFSQTVAPQTYQFIVTDTNGYADIVSAYLLLTDRAPAGTSPTSTVTNACYLRYDQSTNKIFIASDGGSFVGAVGVTVGSASVVSNSQCSVTGSNVSVSASGNTLSFTIVYNFNSIFSGAQLAAAQTVQTLAFPIGSATQGQFFSGWNSLGTVIVPPVAAPFSITNLTGMGGGGGGGATIPSTTNLISGNGSGNGADSGIAPASVVTQTATQTLTNKTIGVSQLSGVLPIVNGGTGTTTPGIVAGSNVTVTGSWPNQTIASTGGGGGGATTNLSLTGPTLSRNPNFNGGLFTYGDSITNNVGSSGTCNNGATSCGYASLLNYAAMSNSGTNKGRSGSFACDVVWLDLFPTSNPGPDFQPFFTEMIGTNDANNRGVGTYENIYKGCHQAGLSWLAIPTTSKTLAQQCTAAGGFANDSTLGTGVASVASTNGATLTCSLTTTASNPIYIWYKVQDSNGGTFTYNIDGSGAVALTTATTPVINAAGGPNGVFLQRVTGISAGTHSIVFTVTSSTSGSNTVTIAGVGTVPSTPYFGGPLVFSAGVPRQQNDALSAATAAYNTDALADVNLLAGDGLNIKFVDIRKYLCTTQSGGICLGPTGVADMSDTLHPNNLGHSELYGAFSYAMNYVPQAGVNFNAFGAPIFSSNNAVPPNVGYYGSANGNVSSINGGGLNKGWLLYGNQTSTTGDVTGADLGVTGGRNVYRIFGRRNSSWGFTVAGTPNGSLAGLQSDFQPWFSIPFDTGHLFTSTPTAPTVTGCGTGATIDALATDMDGTVTVGTGATGCNINFLNSFTAAPHCTVTARSGTITGYTTNTTQIGVAGTTLSVIDYVCRGK
jgi:hypothetical protein